MATTTTPVWLDRGRYPFEPNWFDAGPGRMHYLDAGDGDHVVVALHGNPTWSFMYRRLARSLGPGYRVVAPDYLGHGRSDAPSAFSYRARAQATVVAAFLDSLDAESFSLVAHDWGGPIGLAYALDHPERLRSLVLANTFCWPAERVVTRAFSRLVGGPAGRIACERYNLFARALVPLAFGDRTRLSPSVRAHYVEPLARADRRTASWQFPRDLTRADAWLGDLWARRDALGDVPTLLLWGMADPIVGGPALSRFARAFPQAGVERFEDVGHYVPEEAGDTFVERVASFLARTG